MLYLTAHPGRPVLIYTAGPLCPISRPIKVQILQPVHPDFVDKLLPEYLAFHNANSLYAPNVHTLPWNPTVRQKPPVAGGSEPLKVGTVEDIALSKCTMRVFTPEGNPPSEGWPVFLFFHGGGWTLGNINTENAFSTNMCKRANCVVVSVDYRLGPEEPYPAAVEDAVEALRWIYEKGKECLRVNVQKFAVGGSSSGANLAAVITHKAALMTPSISLTFQVLVVPVVDNTATSSRDPYPSWKENANTVSLVPDKMIWFRKNYSPNEEDWTKWDNSPIFAPEETFKKCPNAWIGVAELDILRDEGIAYGEKLRKAGAEVETRVYLGSPHPIMAMDG
ncbi:AB hydrolase superfamily protein [Sparassis crispa]|uniref:AB hydrolase superfamily protein n=1 Tax=Sparassis crispa TaxID=139825 RepID=A0A401G740_9APHY|nr:AB hydrolase superfamily protein [Sparassis crispa]GBE77986.1 AB hydrolase superfamily protein [Sparassis crispa]